jgi:formylmethanofuran dehydrogenase subunit C
MRRGSLVSLAPSGEPPALLPTFRLACEYRPAWLDVYGRALAAAGFRGGPVPPRGRYRRYLGDFTELGKGEILSWTGD